VVLSAGSGPGDGAGAASGKRGSSVSMMSCVKAIVVLYGRVPVWVGRRLWRLGERLGESRPMHCGALRRLKMQGGGQTDEDRGGMS